ncbi:MAG: HEAT repeat domain-containing protein [Gammaproteobacteria bacterium]|nr:HEAT repeat domain-containing protein [Gammaproteobacteria bacterium]
MQGAHFVGFIDDRLTVSARDISLRELLTAIARESGFTLVLLGPLQDKMTVEFKRLPLHKAFERILRHRNFAVEYDTSPGASPRVAGLWVFQNGEQNGPVQTIVFTKPETDRARAAATLDNNVVQAVFVSPNPEDREDAVETLGQGGQTDQIANLSLALTDVNTDVREAAIDALADIGGDEAAQALAVALGDENAALREGAVDALAKIGGETAMQVLAPALQDNDEFVRETAAEVLSQIKSRRN